MQKSSQNLNDKMNLVSQPIRENEGGKDPGIRNVLSELTCAVAVDSEEAAMPIDAQPGPSQAVAPPQGIPGYLSRDRLSVDRNDTMWPIVKSGLVILVVLTLAACGSGSATGPGTTSTPKTATATASSSATPTAMQHVRDLRYCEVIPSVQSGSTVNTYVYNTLGLNYCPPAKWNALTEQEVNQEYGSQSAQLNGPRHWVMDNIVGSGSSTTGKTFTFGGIQMQLRGTLTTPAGTPTVGNQFFTPNKVSRSTVFTYTTKTLQPDLKLDTTSTGVAYVVNDNLADSYQRM
jgi:hypothetical protein